MRIATLMIVLVLLPACGQKAPLYLPKDKAPEVSSRVQAGNGLDVAENSNQSLTQQEK
ncbi:MAG: lipoprotein [Gammaproteobacteria bacterium]|jgi:predicted small lipoprotein YifL|nr:lipoprotein [Gammaproteobacteria bacterium]MDG1231759.1 lipoprotein [Pseudomonadales bacterium]MBT5154110.1 lipoprotein [Gammaproteobacteria bacterium]MBT5725408.1 lipoprotein [Gammaproteobacteria bacterium]MBT6582757.1 lipoprotein [Gammaproteobacteria bacterium]